MNVDTRPPMTGTAGRRCDAGLIFAVNRAQSVRKGRLDARQRTARSGEIHLEGAGPGTGSARETTTPPGNVFNRETRT